MGNPCAGVEIGRRARREIQPLTADERKAFRSAIEGTAHEHLWLVLMLTGLSPSEALAIGWEHVDLEGGSIRIGRTLDCKKRELVDGTKRESRKREVPLVPELRGKLRERWMAAGRLTSGLVFATIDGAPLDLDNLRSRHFAEILRAARIHWARCVTCDIDGLPVRAKKCRSCRSETVERLGRPVRIYDLRHGFGTAGLEAGLDVKDVAVLMGHSSTRTTQDVYQHVSRERKRAGVGKIAVALAARDRSD